MGVPVSHPLQSLPLVIDRSKHGLHELLLENDMVEYSSSASCTAICWSAQQVAAQAARLVCQDQETLLLHQSCGCPNSVQLVPNHQDPCASTQERPQQHAQLQVMAWHAL